jgi:NlpC/P60 family putative phage cell wall peptidase
VIRDEALAEARRWIGTPFQHGACLRGRGCDCVGLLRGVWQALYGSEPELFPPYGPRDATALLEAGLQRHLVWRPVASARPGDVLAFAWRIGEPARHCGIRAGTNSVIHAYWRHRVAETALTPWWRRRITSAFSFPERDN